MVGRLHFGTAGIRGEMAAGFNRINDLVIIQTTQGLLRYLKQVHKDLSTCSYVVGYDGRHNSERFALYVANVLLNGGLKVYLFAQVVATPLVSYAVKKYGAVGGVMVTASHNPKKDNGYKVFWSDAAQIINPHDMKITQAILDELEPRPENWDLSKVRQRECCVDPLQDVFDSYVKDILIIMPFLQYAVFRNLNEKASFKMTYSAIHGVGYYYVPKMLASFGFPEKNLVIVEEQVRGKAFWQIILCVCSAVIINGYFLFLL
ncbi:unnamed protein product [Soboliphyme baturini]|uniref:PGM_PMM_I domain-containing protein n=1 Tax=Soboliphyme baturini TaxID=241478 RepID=A0A183IK15_9BILA|nr:unnamed protein product [Soboliphyme baturini]